MSTQKHLWEVDHPYYCNEGNFFARPGSECHSHYRRWQDFVAEQGDGDMDLNLVFRFDWEPPYEDGDSEKPIRWLSVRASFSQTTENTAKTEKVTTSWIVFNSAAE